MKGALATSRASYRLDPQGLASADQVDDRRRFDGRASRPQPMIDADGDFEIAGIAGTAEDAIEALGQVMVDIILLDLEMPASEALRRFPDPRAAKGAKV
jgi:two-component system chemotaxis response regulator CheB